MLRDPSQKQVTLRTCVAWQAGYRGDREGGNESKGEREKKKGGKGEKSTWERERTRGRDSKGGLGLIVPLLSLLHVASKGAPAASANFRLAQTCELLGAN